MKLYLSSYKIGSRAEELKRMVQGRLAFIPNARDYSKADEERRRSGLQESRAEVAALGIELETVDLRDFFGKEGKLRERLGRFAGVWVPGGNTFILRQAMRLSGFDTILAERRDPRFVYGGYSAGICVLAPCLRALQQVDDPDDLPYAECTAPIWEGLGLLDYIILPHYKSDHPESADIDKEVEYCEEHSIPYKTLRDGEVILTEL